jgi:hypothetical protein
MSLTAEFHGATYSVEITAHARKRMSERGITDQLLLSIIETGQIKPKPLKTNAFWVFLEAPKRTDNLICVSLVIESKSLIIKTVLINWRPQ